MAETLKHKILSGILWQGLERVGSQGISFLISIVLARLLTPSEFGVLAIMMVFVAICGVFIDSGFSTALIQKKDVDDVDCSSVFFINIVMAAVFYAFLFAGAPLIADFYDSPAITAYLRILALVLIIRSFSLVQGTLLTKKMLFYLNFRITWCALLISGGIGTTMAYLGFGVWALITQQLICAAVTCLMQWYLVKWRPKMLFDFLRVREMFRFGWKLFCSSLLDTVYNDIYAILIGKLFNLTTLSFYNRGRSIPALGMGIVNSTIGSVIFPAFAGLQDDRGRMRRLAEKSLKSIMFLVIPVLTLLLILANPLVTLLLTEKWLPCVPFLQLSCLIFLFWPLHTLNLQIITACGRSDVFLGLEIIKKLQLAVVIFVTYRYGVMAMVWGLVFAGPLSFIENSWFNRKLIGYSSLQQFMVILPLLLVAAGAGGISAAALQALQSSWLKLAAGGSLFSVLYLVGAWLVGYIPPDMITILKQRSLEWRKTQSL